jgi:hypothetical protein
MGSSNASLSFTVRPFEFVHLSRQLGLAHLRQDDLFALRFQRPHFLGIPSRLSTRRPGSHPAVVRVPNTSGK